MAIRNGKNSFTKQVNREISKIKHLRNRDLCDMRNELYKRLLTFSDEDFLIFVKEALDCIYKLEYWKSNSYEAFILEPEDNYYWILTDFFYGIPEPRERKYDKALYDFYFFKSEVTLKWLYKKHRQAKEYEPDEWWVQETIDKLEKYIKRLKNWEFNKWWVKYYEYEELEKESKESKETEEPKKWFFQKIFWK